MSDCISGRSGSVMVVVGIEETMELTSLSKKEYRELSLVGTIVELKGKE